MLSDLKFFRDLATHFNLCNENYYEYFNCQDLTKKYKNLIKNLDEKSIDVVCTLISRVQKSFNSEGSVYSVSEKELTDLRNAVLERDSIVKLSENSFAYKKYLLPIKHFNAAIFYDNYFMDEVENLAALKNKDIVDVGAFIGDSALLFSEYTDKNVYAFEPVQDSFKLMRKTIELNGLKNVIPVELGLGAESVILPINIFGTNSVGSSLTRKFKDAKTVNIKIDTLDNYAVERKLNIGLIKVDIEGAEQDFLKGAMKIIIEQKPVLIFSIYHTAKDLFEIKPMIEELNLGYKFKIRKASKHSILDDTCLIAEVIK